VNLSLACRLSSNCLTGDEQDLEIEMTERGRASLGSLRGADDAAASK
jgi:hypothetical protein